MNKILEKEIIDTIRSNRVVRHTGWGVDTYSVLNKAGKEIICVTNGWDAGIYAVSMNGQNIASVGWNTNPLTKNTYAVSVNGQNVASFEQYTNSLTKNTKEQRSVFNIIGACICRLYDQDDEKQAQENIALMTEKDKAALMFLQSMQKTR